MSKRRALTLIEVILSLSILGAFVVVSAFSFRTIHVKNQSRAAAEVLATSLRAANLRARAQGFPVAVGIPTDIGKTPLARGYYQLEGPVRPPLKRGYDFASEFPDAVIFSGIYPGPTWSEPLPELSRGSGFTFEDWFPPFPSDGYFVFLPSGEVVSNRSAGDGVYRIVVGSRATHGPPEDSASELTRPAEGQLKLISNPHTITISPQGVVTVEAGLLGGDPACIRPARSLPDPGLVAFTPPMYRGPNREPILVDPKLISIPEPNRPLVEVLSEPNYFPYTMVKESGGQIQLTFFAQDPDGDLLHAKWTSENLTDPNRGEGSWSNQDSPMRWHYRYHAWYRASTWYPPSDALEDERFRLHCEITDGRGGILRPSAYSTVGYANATNNGFEVGISSNLRVAYTTPSSALNVTDLDGNNGAPVLDAPQMAAATPAQAIWSTARQGVVYLGADNRPRILQQLNGAQPEDIGNGNSTLSVPVRGLAVTGQALYSLGGATEGLIEKLPEPPNAGNGTVEPVVSIPETEGKFKGLLMSSDQKALITTNEAGKFVAIWIDEPVPPPFHSFTGPALKNTVLLGDQLYGESASGLVRVQISINAASHSLTFSSPTLLANSTGCVNPKVSPDGRFLVAKQAGLPILFNLAVNESTQIPNVSGLSEMVWSER